MKARFVTTLKPKTITDLKIMAAKADLPVNALIEKMVEEKRKKGEK